jgi:hypothetical protein
MKSVVNLSRANLLSNGKMPEKSKLENTKLIIAIKRPVNTLSESNFDIYTFRQRLYDVDEILGEKEFTSILNIFLSDGTPIEK